MVDPAVGHLLGFFLAAIFAWSGAMKLADLARFEDAIAQYRLLPRRLAKPLALAVPVCESAGAAGLLFPATQGRAVLGLMGLLCVFSGAIAINLIRGRTEVDCGCFGPALRQQLSPWLLARNAVLIAIVAVEAFPVGARPLVWADAVTSGLGAGVLVLLYFSANHVIATAPQTRALGAF